MDNREDANAVIRELQNRDAAGAAVDHVDTASFQFQGKGNPVVQIPTVLSSVNGGYYRNLDNPRYSRGSKRHSRN
jgi:hypothetical protein